CSAWLSSLAHTAAAERHQGEVRLGKGAADAEVAVELRVLITFTQAPLLRLLQAPPMLPAEGPCSKPAGNRMRVLEAWSEDAPGCITFKAPNTGQISPDDEIYVSACLRPSLSSSQFLHSDRRWLSSAEEASGQVGSQLQTSGISTHHGGWQEQAPYESGKKGAKKKVVDSFSKKDWYDVKALAINIGKTLVTKTQETKITSDDLTDSVFEVSLADLQNDEVAFRKFKLITEDVQGKKLPDSSPWHGSYP
ncbi:hypothetical protein E2I00_014462, partial [Balaenoptera physalus]